MKLELWELGTVGLLAGVILQNFGLSDVEGFGVKEGITENDKVFYLDFKQAKISLNELNRLLEKLNPREIQIFNDVHNGLRILASYSLSNTGYTYQVILPLNDEILKSLENEQFPAKVPAGKFLLANVSSIHLPSGELGIRVYFRIFKDAQELEKFQKMLEEIEKRDHRFLGQKLDLFSFWEDLIGSGLPLFHPNGMRVRLALIQLIRQINDILGFEEVFTPHIWKTEITKVSGHYYKYAENMFIFRVGDEEFTVKPMNCPAHILIYKSRERSEEDLPVRYSEFGVVYRNEIPGALRGLLRVRMITQDDHHLFVTEEQIKPEIFRLVLTIVKLYQFMGFQEVRINLSTKPEKYIGSDELWEKAETTLKEILDEIKKNLGIEYFIKEGEGAFYGPKIDFDVRDSWGRWWQLGTIQLDFFQPQRFGLNYSTSQGPKVPVMIHTAFLGSLERFMAVYLENFGGRFPMWMAPIQAAVVPVSEKSFDYAKQVYRLLKLHGIRAVLDLKDRTLSYKIRYYEDLKVPAILVVGQREAEQQSVSIREKGSKEIKVVSLQELPDYFKEKMSEVNKFLEQLRKEIKALDQRYYGANS
jgi:threonyl-tRNA synthetase